jgi:hypothetical protein
VTDLAGNRSRADAPEAQCILPGKPKPPTLCLAFGRTPPDAAGRRSVSVRHETHDPPADKGGAQPRDRSKATLASVVMSKPAGRVRP